MAQPVTVYRWDDPGAPVIDAVSPSRIIDLLKKVLVEGYGTKAPLGWTVEFENPASHKIVFKNSPVTGSGGAFQIWSPDGTDSTTFCLVRGAQSITALDTFINGGFVGGFNLHNNLRRWVIVGTASAFYIMFHHVSRGYSHTTATIMIDATYFIGDFIPAYPFDQCTFITTVPNDGSTSTYVNDNTLATKLSPFNSEDYCKSSLAQSSGSANQVLVPLGIDGSAVSDTYGLGTFTRASVVNTTQIFDGDYPDILAFIAPVAIAVSRNMAEIVNINAEHPPVRGVYPGLVSQTNLSNRLSDWPVSREVGDYNYYLIAHDRRSNTTLVGGYLLINAEVWPDVR